MKLVYLTTKDVAKLTGLNTRKALRWMKQSGVAFRRPGAHHQYMMPFDKVREKWPELWDKYCIEEGMWDALAECDHDDTSEIGNVVEWCNMCGGVRVLGASDWRLPTRRPLA